MSKLVFNEVKVFGNKSELMDFEDDVASNGSEFSFKKIIDAANNNTSSDKKQSVFCNDWEGEPWGIIWDALHVELVHFPECLYYQFITVWSAPFPIYDRLVEKYKKLNLQFGLHLFQYTID
jgi:hypothetical protein